MRTAVVMMSLLLTTGAFAQTPASDYDAPSSSVQGSQIKTYQIQRKDAVSVQFPEDVAELTPEEQKKLDEIVEVIQQRRDGQVFVAAWSDVQAPSSRGQSLTSKQRSLAERRADAVRDYLRQRNVSNQIERINMATYPSRLASLFNTRTTVIKGKGNVRNQQAFVIDQMGDQMRRLGGPDSAVVVVLSRDQPGRQVSH